ncbi:unnamed protein product [Effrenium voratum]|nr:unnamed protein product [Effrenium voratum]
MALIWGSGGISSFLPANPNFPIRSFPLIANVAAETSVRLLWMPGFGFWSVMGWCAAVIVTVIIGAEGLAQIPEIQDPLLQAIVAGSSQPQTAEQLVSGLGGSLLVINLIPLRLLYWGPGIIWKLLVVENTRMNAGGLLILVYCSLCIVWIWPMVVGTFISALREGQTTDMRRKVAAAREAAEISVVDLIDMFEDLVQDSTERFISLDDFRDLHTQCPAISSLLGGGSKLNFTEIIFRDMDVMGHHFLTLPDFVLGFLKLIRVMPQAEFMHMDEQQRRAHLPGFGVEPFADMRVI